MKLAIIALLGSSSAIQYSSKWKRYQMAQMRDTPGQPYSNELANGDKSDDKQL